MAGELRTLGAGRLNVVAADNELRLLAEAVKPNDQSTSLFAAISVMVGFLLALNAMLLTVPERRRFVADLRMQGYDWRQVVVLLAFQAAVLGVVASAAGVAARRHPLPRLPASHTGLPDDRLSGRHPGDPAHRDDPRRGWLRRACDDARVAVPRAGPASGPSSRRGVSRSRRAEARCSREEPR